MGKKNELKKFKKEVQDKMDAEEQKLNPRFMEENRHHLNSLKYQVIMAKTETELLDLRNQWKQLVFIPANHRLVEDLEELDRIDDEMERIKQEVQEFSDEYMSRLSADDKLILIQLKKNVENAPSLYEKQEPYQKWLQFTHQLLLGHIKNLKFKNGVVDLVFNMVVGVKDEKAMTAA